jgi:GNAT superfamily N-acetyltransferase
MDSREGKTGDCEANKKRDDIVINSRYKHIEEYSLNAWPSLSTFIYDGWLLRFAKGFTKRSNSINPIYNAVSQKLVEKIQYVESIYTSAGLDTIFKITPFVPSENLDLTLENMGYDIVEPSSVQVLDLTITPEPRTNEIKIDLTINDEWLDVVTKLNNLSEAHRQITRELFSPSYLRKGFFTLYQNGLPVACGVGIIEGDYVGLYDIVTDSNYRKQGHATELLIHILKWARENGATQSYLQVVKANTPAVTLYKKLGYQEIYTYWYRCSRLVL